MSSAPFKKPSFTRDVIVIVGGYGSGKSEISVNLARYLAAHTERPVSIADLDVINPYFRSREAAAPLAELGIKSLVPPGEQSSADLPIIIPEIKGAIQQHDGWLILDVGGDEAGANVLSSLSDAFRPGTYDLLLTVNAYRPFTADLAGTMKIMGEIERAGKLNFTGLISNSHLIEQTGKDEILHGIALCKQVSEKSGLPVAFVSGMTEVIGLLKSKDIPYPVLPIDRSLLKPWERPSAAGQK